MKLKTGKVGMIKMGEFIKWNDVKNSMTSLTDEEKGQIDMLSDIVSKIIEKRITLGLSQRDLEKITGVKQAAICRIENMRNMPQLDTLMKLMEPLGLRLYVGSVEQENQSNSEKSRAI
jgi:ribosome-binding protein aMBF1 (putative translation factor)